MGLGTGRDAGPHEEQGDARQAFRQFRPLANEPVLAEGIAVVGEKDLLTQGNR